MLFDRHEAQFIRVPFRLREDLKPTYDKRVDQWLRSMVEPSQFEQFQAAIGYLIAVYDGPTAAVSLVGAKSTGKKMLAHGLSECFTPVGSPVPGVELTTRFNEALIHNPIIWVDEGVDEGKSGAAFADVFRRVVTGGTMSVEPKGKSKIEISGVHRILFTANNVDAVRSIGGRKARTAQDWEALSERIVHFQLRNEAAHYLRSIGGLTGTLGWIKGDAGQSSRYVVARHILWIYYNVLPRDENGALIRQGVRLLMEGAARQDILEDLEADGELVPEVVLAINDLLSVQIHGSKVKVEGSRVYFQTSAVVEKIREKNSGLKFSDIRQTFYAIAPETCRKRFNNVVAQYHVADASKIYRLVEQHATPCMTLAKASGFDPEIEGLRATMSEDI